MGLMVDKIPDCRLSIGHFDRRALARAGQLSPGYGCPREFEHLVADLGAAMPLTLRPDTLRVRWQALWLVPDAGALNSRNC